MLRDNHDNAARAAHTDHPLSPSGPHALPSSADVAWCCIEAYNRRDLRQLRRLAHPDMELDWSESRWLGAGLYRGIDAVLGFYEDYFDVFERGTIEPECLVEVGHSVVIPNVARLRGRDGIEVAARSTLSITVLRGRVSHIRLYQAPL
jgi:ketosteroid isomerase-like protein